jgi:signal transduction histidine kinase
MSGFRIHIESDEFPEYAGEVAGYLGNAHYRIEAEYDGAGAVVVRLNGGRPVRQPWPGEPLACGPARTRILAFDLETESLARVGPRAEVRAWLREWSGVSVYRDGFRIWPYGEPHDDWLRLDQRRVNNPVVRLSNNQVVGFVEITGDGNPELRDQTSREGLIHNEAFADLQRLVLFVMQLLEADRQAVRHPASSDSRSEGARTQSGNGSSLVPAIEKLAEKADGEVASQLRHLGGRARADEIAKEYQVRRLLEGYSELAAVGHGAAVLGRSIEASLEKLSGILDDLDVSGNDPIARVLERARSTIGLAREQIEGISRPAAGSRRRRGIDLPVELERIRRSLGPLLDRAGATLEISVENSPELPRTEMRPEAFTAIIAAVVNNSIEWADPGRRLRIQAVVRITGAFVELAMSDNGAGVYESLQETLFEPQVSGRDGGAGMGLTLARDMMTAHGGRIDLVTDRRRKGATFRLTFLRKRARATTPHR